MERGLNSAWLKIIALITMTIDHIGMILFPEQLIYRYIGRIAFPIFAYLIAESYQYTRDKKKFFLKMLCMAVITQLPYIMFEKSLYLNIFCTFVISILAMMLMDLIDKKTSEVSVKIAVIAVIYFIGNLIENSLTFKIMGITIDYGVLGALVPVLVYVGRGKIEKIIYFFLGLLAVALAGHTHVQIYSLISVVLMMLYNGKRGYNGVWFKQLFWVYYPLHLGILYLIKT